MDITQTRRIESVALTFEIENTGIFDDVLTVSYSKQRYLPTHASVTYTRDNRRGDEWNVSRVSIHGANVLKNGELGQKVIEEGFFVHDFKNNPERYPEWLVRLVKGSVPR